jgi:nucleoside-diphosphate-sugar epimerase
LTTRGLVVITGADGFAGRVVCAHLRSTDVPFRGLVRTLSPATAARPDMLPVGDLTTITDDALHNALRGAQAVVHLAGCAGATRVSVNEPRATLRAINVAATERLARAAAAAGVAHFVFASSVKVNGETSPPERPLREDDPPDPRDNYAASKWEAECMLADVARETMLPVTILRLPLLYGPGVKGNVARLTDAIARGVPLPLGVVGNLRSMLGAGNFASALDALLTAPAATSRAVATWFVTDREPVSTEGFARAIAAALGVKARLVAIPLPLLRMASACLGRAGAVDRLTGSLVVDGTGFRSAFGWQPPYSLADELAATVRARRESALAPL